jgi:predicted nucleotidyltransferase
MAGTAPQAFDEFAGRLALTKLQREALKSRRDTIRGYISADWRVMDAYFGGSHARGTKIRKLGDKQGDVDIYVVLADAHRAAYGGMWAKEPKQLLSDIKATLDKKLKTPSLRADSPAVRINYEDMIVDVVPSFRRSSWGTALDIPYYSQWMVATPKGQEKTFGDLHKARGYLLRPLIRMIKHWKAVHTSFPLRSYHVETLTYMIFESRPINDYRQGLLTFFESADTYVLYNWNDPGGSGNSVSAYMSSTARDQARSMFKEAARLARAAIEAPTWKEEIERWRSPSLLGSRFPAYTP